MANINPHNHLLNDKECAFITNGVCISSYSPNDQFAVTPCCYFNVKKLQPKEIERHYNFSLNGYLKDVNSDPDFTYPKLSQTACNKCYRKEELNGYQNIRASNKGQEAVYSSLRGRAHQRVPEKFSPGKIVHLDIEFSNFCNFQCLYCDSANSSEWNKTAKQLHSRFDKSVVNEYNTYDNEIHILEQILLADLSDLRMVYIKGGEPFMVRVLDDFFIRLADKCDLSKVSLHINTNNSLFPNDRILKSFSNMKEVHMRLSGESTGKLAEYVRFGTNWNTFTINAKRWVEISKAHPNIKIEVQSAVSIYTINYWNEWYDWLLKVGINPENNWPSTVYNQEQYYMKLLSRQQADTLQKRFEDIPHVQWREFYRKECKSDRYNEIPSPTIRKTFQDLTIAIDKVRNNSLADVNPEIYRWLYQNFHQLY
jgi:sulfatase maturation enzyme AslB (radical SAM superfamily)